MPSLSRGLLVAMLALAGIGTPVAPTVAQDRWLAIARDLDQAIAIDSHSVVQVDSGTFQAWILTEYRKLQRFPSGLTFQSVMERADFDCPGRRMGILEALWRDREGQVVSSVRPSEAQWSSVVPGTRGEGKWEAVCTFGISHSGRLPRAAPSPGGGD